MFRAPISPRYPAPPKGVATRIADSALLAPYVDRDGYELSQSFTAPALARGEHCVVTLLDGELAAYGWVSYRATPHLHGLWVTFDAGQRYNFKSFTLPAYRGRHLRGSFGALQALDQQQGASHTISFIALHNRASIRAEQRNGGRLAGYAGYWRHPWGAWPFRSAGARRCGFRFYRPGTESTG